MPENDGDFSVRWRLLKFYFSSHFPPSAARSASKVAKGEKGVWQRRFWEHQIRGEQDFQRHVDDIHYHPVKHGLVRQAAEWPHSSFHRFVAQGKLHPDWGCAESWADDFGEWGALLAARVGASTHAPPAQPRRSTRTEASASSEAINIKAHSDSVGAAVGGSTTNERVWPGVIVNVLLPFREL